MVRQSEPGNGMAAANVWKPVTVETAKFAPADICGDRTSPWVGSNSSERPPSPTTPSSSRLKLRQNRLVRITRDENRPSLVISINTKYLRGSKLSSSNAAGGEEAQRHSRCAGTNPSPPPSLRSDDYAFPLPPNAKSTGYRPAVQHCAGCRDYRPSEFFQRLRAPKQGAGPGREIGNNKLRRALQHARKRASEDLNYEYEDVDKNIEERGEELAGKYRVALEKDGYPASQAEEVVRRGKHLQRDPLAFP